MILILVERYALDSSILMKQIRSTKEQVQCLSRTAYQMTTSVVVTVNMHALELIVTSDM